MENNNDFSVPQFTCQDQSQILSDLMSRSILGFSPCACLQAVSTYTTLRDNKSTFHVVNHTKNKDMV